VILPVALSVAALAMPSAVLAAEGTSGYNQTPSTPSTTTTKATTPTTTPTTPQKEISPTKESTTPSTSPSPSKETKPTGSTEAAKASGSPSTTATTLPFTGLDLRWTIAIGLLLLGAGFSIVFLLRGLRRDGN
jgi:cobalamin biosynthesis Mg chelatase CobN